MKKLLIVLLIICGLVFAAQPAAQGQGVSFGFPLPFPFLFYIYGRANYILLPTRAQGLSAGIPLPFAFLFYNLCQLRDTLSKYGECIVCRHYLLAG
jgi:hypothetical protein